MIKNLIETKEGRKVVTVFGLVVLVIGIFIWSYSSGSEQVKADKTKESTELVIKKETEREVNNATIYSGKWYSNRSDNTVIELQLDGKYSASNWITTGTYRLVGQTMVFEDQTHGNKTFQLQTRFGNTVMYLKEGEEEILLFPNEEVKSKILNHFSSEKENMENLQNQKWLDILRNTAWLAENQGMKYNMLFSRDSYEQVKVDDTKDENESKVFDYRIISQELEEKSCLFVIARNKQESSEVEEISFRITEEETQYVLSAAPGMFLWTATYKKALSDVSLTQNGTLKEESENITEVTTDEDQNQVVTIEDKEGE